MHEREPTSHQPSLVSFRDPSGRLFSLNGRILRGVHKSAVPDISACLASPAARALVAAGRLVRTEILDSTALKKLRTDVRLTEILDGTEWEMVLEHEKISFATFPYEWAPEMLHSAGQLTLELAQRLLIDGLGLKDATPYNILFRGPKPVFIDILSVERRDPNDPTWIPYAQFVRTFLLPLLLNKHFDIPLQQIFTTRRDGVEPEEVYRLCGPLQKVKSPFLTLVTVPTLLGAKSWRAESNIYQKRHENNPEKARFVLEHVLNHLRRVLDRLEPKRARPSSWSNYMISDNSYSGDNFKAKHGFVEATLKEFRPKKVLDVGCNTGHFSAIAANNGSAVVAIDSDPSVVSTVYRNAVEQRLNILPLTVDLTRSSPAIGWRNRECPAFLSRAHGAFDAVFMLAVIHHMLVTERIPLSEIVNLSAELTNDLLVIEFIGSDDPLFRHLARGRDALFSAITRDLFEATCKRRFDIVRRQQLGASSRWLYLMRKTRFRDFA